MTQKHERPRMTRRPPHLLGLELCIGAVLQQGVAAGLLNGLYTAGGREGGREGEREGGSEEGRERQKEGEREGGREGGNHAYVCVCLCVSVYMCVRVRARGWMFRAHHVDLIGDEVKWLVLKQGLHVLEQAHLCASVACRRTVCVCDRDDW